MEWLTPEVAIKALGIVGFLMMSFALNDNGDVEAEVRLRKTLREFGKPKKQEATDDPA